VSNTALIAVRLGAAVKAKRWWLVDGQVGGALLTGAPRRALQPFCEIATVRYLGASRAGGS
jgi:hypothetical protein